MIIELNLNTVKLLFVVFVGDTEKERWMRENYRWGGPYKTEFIEGPME
jgi:hypothetical protein